MLIVRRRGGRETGRIQQDMEQVFRSLVIGVRPISRSNIGVWRPPVEVYECEDCLVVTVEIAGLQEEEISVIVDETLLRVAGVRQNPSATQKRTYHEMGIAYGQFEAQVFLPFAIVLDEVEASYQGGFLTVTLPRAQATRIVPRASETPAPVQEG
jgi:HSP20 family molecular chaperone IbpA